MISQPASLVSRSCEPYTHPDWLFFQCAPSGCLMELAQQLVIIMVGKQTINNVQEIVIP